MKDLLFYENLLINFVLSFLKIKFEMDVYFLILIIINLYIIFKEFFIIFYFKIFFLFIFLIFFLILIYKLGFLLFQFNISLNFNKLCEKENLHESFI